MSWDPGQICLFDIHLNVMMTSCTVFMIMNEDLYNKKRLGFTSVFQVQECFQGDFSSKSRIWTCIRVEKGRSLCEKGRGQATSC